MNRKIDTYTRLENGKNDEGFVASSTVGEALVRTVAIMPRTCGRTSTYDAAVQQKYSAKAATRGNAAPRVESPTCTAYFATNAVGITTMLRFAPSLMSMSPTSTENHTEPMPPKGLPTATKSALLVTSPIHKSTSPAANSARQASDHAPSRSTAGRR